MSVNPTSRPPVSVVIITKNEEAVIERCLASASWADEILIVDGESTDKTRELALQNQKPWTQVLKWVERPWSGFKDQRNFSIQQAKNDWILVLDADEAISEELRARIFNFFRDGSKPPQKAYKVRRVEYFLKKPIQHGIWNPSYQDRFFHRDGVTYINDIHEYPKFSCVPHDLHEPIHHWPDFNPEKFLQKMNRYTSIEARDRYNQGQRTNLVHLLGSFFAMFLKNYFYYGAYKDGMHGLIVSLLEGVSRVVRHIKMWQIEQEKK